MLTCYHSATLLLISLYYIKLFTQTLFYWEKLISTESFSSIIFLDPSPHPGSVYINTVQTFHNRRVNLQKQDPSLPFIYHLTLQSTLLGEYTRYSVQTTMFTVDTFLNRCHKTKMAEISQTDKVKDNKIFMVTFIVCLRVCDNHRRIKILLRVTVCWLKDMTTYGNSHVSL